MPRGSGSVSKVTFWPSANGLEALGLNGGEVDEHVLAALVVGDKAKTLGLVEPLNCSLIHFYDLQKFVPSAKQKAHASQVTTMMTYVP